MVVQQTRHFQVLRHVQVAEMVIEKAKRLVEHKKDVIILHPGPINRGVELDPEVADGPRSVILEQVFNGVIVRMAVLATYCNPEGLADWLKRNSKNV